MPSRVAPVQNFPAHISRIPRNVYKNVTLFEKLRHIPLLQWSNKWDRSFYGMDGEAPVEFDVFFERITMKESAICHAEAGMELFATKKTGQ